MSEDVLSDRESALYRAINIAIDALGDIDEKDDTASRKARIAHEALEEMVTILKQAKAAVLNSLAKSMA